MLAWIVKYWRNDSAGNGSRSSPRSYQISFASWTSRRPGPNQPILGRYLYLREEPNCAFKKKKSHDPDPSCTVTFSDLMKWPTSIVHPQIGDTYRSDKLTPFLSTAALMKWRAFWKEDTKRTTSWTLFCTTLRTLSTLTPIIKTGFCHWDSWSRIPLLGYHIVSRC